MALFQEDSFRVSDRVRDTLSRLISANREQLFSAD
jgi:hypothetical protein